MRKILYLGDTHLKDAAAYLAGVIHHWGWSFDYLPSDAKPASEQWENDYGLFILSDYPASQLSDSDQQQLLARVAAGAGLLMIGGWESFHGLGGDWDGTAIGDILPVEISSEDDRRNCDQPVLVRRVKDHPLTEGLPWQDRPPVIGGFNQVQAKANAEVILEACVFDANHRTGEEFTFHLAETLPLLVVGQHENGRVATFQTDVAPHWVGPLVDWGPARVGAQAPNANEIEVGSDYAQFLKQLLEWTARG